MDYIIQMERLFKFLELNLDTGEIIKLTKLKKEFNNDLNLFACFVADFITIKRNIKSKDEDIYNNFVLCFDKYKDNDKIEEFIDEFCRYAKIYHSIVFEDTTDRIFLNAVASANSCDCLECYPFLMEVADDFFNKKIDVNSFALVLQSLVDLIFKNFENPDAKEMSLGNLRKMRQGIYNKIEEIAV